LANSDHLKDDGLVSAAAFVPNKKTAANRDDGYAETSINWEDDERALPFTWKQGTTRFGIARVSIFEIDAIGRLPGTKEALSYERAALPKNTYHGNILIHASLPAFRQKMIATALALAAETLVESGE
jgi:hypothetical protein